MKSYSLVQGLEHWHICAREAQTNPYYISQNRIAFLVLNAWLIVLMPLVDLPIPCSWVSYKTLCSDQVAN